MKKDKYLAAGYASLIMGVIPLILSISYFYSNYDPGYGPFPFPPYIAWSILVLDIIPITAVFVGWYYLLIGFGRRPQPQKDRLSMSLILLGEMGLGILILLLKNIGGGSEEAGLIGAIIAGSYVMFIGLPSLVIFWAGILKSKVLPKWKIVFLLVLLLGSGLVYSNEPPMTDQGFRADKSDFVKYHPDLVEFTRKNKNCLGYKIYHTWAAAKLNPEEVCFMELYSYDNPEQDIPTDISIFPNLVWLSWDSENDIKSLPSGFGKLVNLRNLSISHLSVDSLPSDFSNLKNLTSLSLSGRIKELPDDISNLTNLKILGVTSYGLEKLPSGIGNLSNLETLQVSSSFLLGLPSSIGNLKKLSSLELGNTLGGYYIDYQNGKTCDLFGKMTELPNEIGNLSNLKTLSITGYGLEKLSPNIGKLKNLEILTISNSKLKELPDEMGDLTSLKSLLLPRNDLRFLPKNLAKLSNLERIDVMGNPLLIVSQELLDIERWNLCVTIVNNKCVKQQYGSPRFPPPPKGVELIKPCI